MCPYFRVASQQVYVATYVSVSESRHKILGGFDTHCKGRWERSGPEIHDGDCTQRPPYVYYTYLQGLKCAMVLLRSMIVLLLATVIIKIGILSPAGVCGTTENCLWRPVRLQLSAAIPWPCGAASKDFRRAVACAANGPRTHGGKGGHAAGQLKPYDDNTHQQI